MSFCYHSCTKYVYLSLVFVQETDMTEYIWRLQNGYMYNKVKGYLHKYLMLAEPDETVYFKNKNKLDIRINNLIVKDAKKKKKEKDTTIIDKHLDE